MRTTSSSSPGALEHPYANFHFGVNGALKSMSALADRR